MLFPSSALQALSCKENKQIPLIFKCCSLQALAPPPLDKAGSWSCKHTRQEPAFALLLEPVCQLGKELVGHVQAQDLEGI